MKTLITSTAIALLFIGTAGAATAADMNAWDTNHDGVVEHGEFKAAMANDKTFGACDTDHNGVLSQDEFEDCVFSMNDSQGNNSWNQNDLQSWLQSSVRSGRDVSANN